MHQTAQASYRCVFDLKKRIGLKCKVKHCDYILRCKMSGN